MHGCPPEEIEQITTYLLNERGLNTSVKCNPTLLGAERVRGIINDELGFTDIVVPDEAFGHDLKYVDAVPMFHNLKRIAKSKDLTFGLKLSNTLEVENHRMEFPDDDMMYMSGRALHAVTTNLALRLSEEFRGDLLLSFAGGADAFNVTDLLRSGMTTITVCSDLLKTGGYLRMPQYIEELNLALDKAEAADLTDLSGRTALAEHHYASFSEMLAGATLGDSGLAFSLADAHELAAYLGGTLPGPVADSVHQWAVESGYSEERAATLTTIAIRTLARVNLRSYAHEVQKTGDTAKNPSGPTTRRPRESSGSSTASRPPAWMSARSHRTCPPTCGPYARADSTMPSTSRGPTTRFRRSSAESATTFVRPRASERTWTSPSQFGT